MPRPMSSSGWAACWEDGLSVAERIVVGMSGGVDSSVAAALLVEQGYDVVGVTLRVWPWKEATDAGRRFGSCCSAQTVDDARSVARRLGIPHFLLNSEEEFDRSVINRFVSEYRHGRTPVPCVACNKELKFGSLLRRAHAWDAVAVATGHYARVTRDPATGGVQLWKARDARKDQSDFLWSLTVDQLASARFPVGELTKDEVRECARRLGLVATDVNFIAGERPCEPLRVDAKIRHRHLPARATVRLLDSATAEVVFEEPQRAITPGQSVVWYDGELVIGGGVIARAR